MAVVLLPIGCVGLSVFLFWGLWNLAFAPPVNVFWHLNWLMAALPGIPLSLASIFFGWRAKWRQLKAEKTQHSLEKKRKSKKRHKDRWYLLIEGLTWISLGAVSIVVAMSWWGSVPRGYSDYGMEPFAKFLEYVVISVPVGVLILAGAVGLIVGAGRVLVALTILFHRP
jgi:hypothetical protein